MEPMRERFSLLSDKELLLQILNLNNIPSVELVDPRTCAFPIIGRKYGHGGGTDISIVHSKDQAMHEGYDYFTKMYSFEKEYQLEVEALTVQRAQVAEGLQVVYQELPIRTEPFGWCWQEIISSHLPADWLNMAVRAVYVTGLPHGFVKIGVLENGTAIVTDLNTSGIPYKEQDMKPDLPFTMGADIEFMLNCDGELLPASTFFPVMGAIGCDERQIEQDSGEYALAEIRPDQAESPLELFNNIKKLILEAAEKVPYANVRFRAGSMPFSGYQCGGHIHFGMPLSLSLLRALDQYVAIPVALIEDPRTAKLRRRTNHGGLGRFRKKPYGFEYLSLSSWIVDPKLTLSILSLAWLVAAHHHELTNEFLFHPLIQRAYYQGNQIFLKQLWGDIKTRLQQTTGFSEFENELRYLFEVIERGAPNNESSDIRDNWGVIIPEEIYEQGDVIQIPKKTRLKYNLKSGQPAMVCAGKVISSVIIRPYPFSFRSSNMIQLSKSVRDKLCLPKDWIPKISSINGVITLGPIIGILASRPFDRQTTYFQHLCRIAQENQMLAYVFEPQDINWEEMTIKGIALNGDGLFPLPGVVYDRYFLGGDPNVSIDEVRVRLQSVYKIPFINPPSLYKLTGDKWKTHQFLAGEYGEFLPDTRLLKSPADFTKMLDSYGEVYLKPLGGALSKGVIRVIRRPAGIYWLDLHNKTFNQLHDQEELYTMLSPLFKNTAYLVQEGIRRKKYNGKNLEFRVYLQKNEKRIWLRTGVVARLTNEDVLTEETEMNMRFSKVMNRLYPDPAERHYLSNKMAKISQNIVAAIEHEIGKFGELAVDLCIDQYNSIKLLEINAKPDNLFSQIRAYKLRTLAGNRLLNYAASLTNDEEDKNM